MVLKGYSYLNQIFPIINFPYFPDLSHKVWARLPAGWCGLIAIGLSNMLECLDLPDKFTHISTHRRCQYFNGLDYSIRINNKAAAYFNTSLLIIKLRRPCLCPQSCRTASERGHPLSPFWKAHYPAIFYGQNGCLHSQKATQPPAFEDLYIWQQLPPTQWLIQM